MIDTHCHIFKEYYSDIGSLVKKLKDNGVTQVIVNGTDMKSNLEVLDLVNKYDIIYGAIGFHPTELSEYDDTCLEWLEKHINDDKIVAIGEIGLDYHYDNTDKDKELYVFKRQLELAVKYNKPVIVHSRDAIKDTYDVMSNYDVKASIHAFSGSLEMAEKFIKKGYYLGIGGVCTFKNAKNIVNVIENVPLEYILLETDSPYLSPEPYRGQVNTPDNVLIVAKRIGEIKKIDFDKVVKITTSNAHRLFDF